MGKRYDAFKRWLSYHCETLVEDTKQHGQTTYQFFVSKPVQLEMLADRLLSTDRNPRQLVETQLRRMINDTKRFNDDHVADRLEAYANRFDPGLKKLQGNRLAILICDRRPGVVFRIMAIEKCHQS